jgi:hypothetical protein
LDRPTAWQGGWRGAGERRPKRLKARQSRPKLLWTWKLGLAVLPILFQFGSFLPLTLFAWVLGRALSIPWTGAAVIDQPYGLLWLVLFLMAIPVFHLGGVAVGLCLSGLALRHIVGLPWHAIPETGLCPGFLVYWLESIELRKELRGQFPKGKDPLFDRELDLPV